MALLKIPTPNSQSKSHFYQKTKQPHMCHSLKNIKLKISKVPMTIPQTIFFFFISIFVLGEEYDRQTKLFFFKAFQQMFALH